jgi:hypothetical protein
MNPVSHESHGSGLLNPRQAAGYLHCSVAWLAKMRMVNAGPAFIKCGLWVRYRASDLDQWVEVNRRGGSVARALPSERVA